MKNGSKLQFILQIPKKVERENIEDMLHRWAFKIQDRVPEQYVTSSTFSMLLDALENDGKIYYIKDQKPSERVSLGFSELKK